MRAIYFTEFNGKLEVKDLPDPIASDRGVVIKVEASGLCRSDWHGYVGHDTDIKLPHVPGHELAGTIASIGSAVKKFKVGDRVTVPFVNGCGDCEFCLRGDAQVCPKQTQPGFTHWGSFAELVALENADFNLINLPDEISFSTAAALGCRFATAYRGLAKRATVKPGEWVAVFGCGGVGLSAIMIAKALGAKVIAVDISERALEQAGKLGAGLLINSKDVDAIASIQTMCGGADVAIDALGSPETTQAAVMSLKRRGRHLQLGLLLTPTGLTQMPMARVIAWELDLLGSHGMAAVDYPEMLELVKSGALAPEKLRTNEIGLAIGTKALAEMDLYNTPGITIINPQH